MRREHSNSRKITGYPAGLAQITRELFNKRSFTPHICKWRTHATLLEYCGFTLDRRLTCLECVLVTQAKQQTFNEKQTNHIQN